VSTDPLAGALAELGTVLYGRLLRNLSAGDGDGTSLTIAQRLALGALETAGVQNIADLAERTGVAPSTATRMVQGLERHGYVRQTTDAADRRCRLIAITDEGAVALARARVATHQRITRLVKAVPAAERDNLARAVDILITALRETDRPGPA
jgi:DNA-binding MarR family transcriptional regulator